MADVGYSDSKKVDISQHLTMLTPIKESEDVGRAQETVEMVAQQLVDLE